MDDDTITQFKNFTTTQHHDTYAGIQHADHRSHTVLVTGASSGIGRAIALSYARAGAPQIAIIARRPLEEVEAQLIATAAEAGHPVPRVLKLVADVTDERSINNAVSELKREFGRLDILVNNAGRVETMSSILEGNPGDWWRTWEVNIKGVYLTTRAFLPILLQGGEKTIANIGSMGAVSPVPGLSGYVSTKLGLLRFIDILTREYEGQGILSFTVYPGDVPTEVRGSFPAEMAQYFVDSPALPGDSITWLTQKRLDWLSGRFISLRWDLPEMVSRQEEIVKGDKFKVTMRI
ncbi:oxidoreductase [Aspergillus carlsbadensis]|nr:oxidoreductase [Aspergillus carlsbadensis]